MEIGERIKDLRSKLGITQTLLAKNAGLTSAAISQFEAGFRKPSFDALSKLASAFNVSTDSLLGKIEESPKPKLAPEYEDMIKGFAELPEEGKKMMLDYYDYVKYKMKQGK
jgi:transcriptional regulator with XRE-family HTH domain